MPTAFFVVSLCAIFNVCSVFKTLSRVSLSLHPIHQSDLTLYYPPYTGFLYTNKSLLNLALLFTSLFTRLLHHTWGLYFATMHHLVISDLLIVTFCPFHVYALRLGLKVFDTRRLLFWNNLHDSLRSINPFSSFRSHLKTCLFCKIWPPGWHPRFWFIFDYVRITNYNYSTIH